MIEKHMENINDEYQRRNSKHTPESDEKDEDCCTVEYHHERNNSLPELFGDDSFQSGWEKYWAKNGERLIWQSWIEKYIDYINPEFLTNMESGNQTGEASAFSFEPKDVEMSSVKNPATEIAVSSPARLSTDDLLGDGWNPLSPASTFEGNQQYTNHHHNHHRNRKQNENDNLLSPRCESVNSSIPLTIGTTDSMTNVTRMTISSYDFGSSRVSSESTPTSTPTDSISISSFSESEESENVMTTRMSADCEKLLLDNGPPSQVEHVPPPAGCESEDFWQNRWQEHAQEKYVKHYNEFMEAHRSLQQEMSNSFKSDSGFLPGEGGKINKRNRRKSSRKKNSESLQRLVANLCLRNDLEKQSQRHEEPSDGGDHVEPSQSDSTVVDTTEGKQLIIVLINSFT